MITYLLSYKLFFLTSLKQRKREFMKLTLKPYHLIGWKTILPLLPHSLHLDKRILGYGKWSLAKPDIPVISTSL